MQKSHKHIYTRFGRYLAPFKWKILLILLLVILSSLGTLVSPWVIKVIIDDIFPKGDYSGLIFILSMLVVVNILRVLFEVATDYIYVSVSGKIVNNIRSDLFYHVTRLPLSFFQHYRRGDIIKRLSDEVDEIEGSITGSVVGFAYNLLTIIGISIALCWLSVELFAISIVVMPLIYLNIKFFQPKIMDLSRKLRSKEGYFSAFLIERVENIQLIKTFNKQKFEQDRLKSTYFDIIQSRIRQILNSSVHRSISIFIISLTPIIIFGWGGGKVMSEALTIGTLIAFLQYLNRLFGPFRELMSLQLELLHAVPAMERVFEYFNYQPSEHLLEADQSFSGIPFDDQIVFNQVSFNYGDKPILKSVDLLLTKGKKYVLVGESGSGKSTILKLLCRYYEPNKGTIFIDGKDISKIDPYAMRATISYIGQQDMMFNDTILNNIRYGSPERSDQEIIEAAELVGISTDIAKMEEGYKTYLGDQGARISGGQRQLMSFARLLLSAAEIIIIDEATSAIDPIREHKLWQKLMPIFKDKTIIAVTHRASTTKYFDHVVCVKDGQVIESGPVEELRQHSDYFRRLFTHVGEINESVEEH